MMKSHVQTFLKFGLIGLLTAGIYFSVMWVADSLLGFGYFLAVTAAYVAATSFQFNANRQFTFRASAEGQHKQIRRYLVLLAINYIVTVLIVSICVERLGLSAYIGVCVSVLVTVFVGYCLSHFWVFKNRKIRE